MYPFLIYRNNVWGNACPASLKKLVLLQKKIIRIIHGVSSRTSCDPLFEESGFLRFADINKYMITASCIDGTWMIFLIYFKVILNQFLSYIRHFTRQSDGLFIPTFRTNLGKTCLTYRSQYIWNKILKLKINLDSSEAVFMKTLKHGVQIGLLKVRLLVCIVIL